MEVKLSTTYSSFDGQTEQTIQILENLQRTCILGWVHAITPISLVSSWHHMKLYMRDHVALLVSWSRLM